MQIQLKEKYAIDGSLGQGNTGLTRAPPTFYGTAAATADTTNSNSTAEGDPGGGEDDTLSLPEKVFPYIEFNTRKYMSGACGVDAGAFGGNE